LCQWAVLHGAQISEHRRTNRAGPARPAPAAQRERPVGRARRAALPGRAQVGQQAPPLLLLGAAVGPGCTHSNHTGDGARSICVRTAAPRLATTAQWWCTPATPRSPYKGSVSADAPACEHLRVAVLLRIAAQHAVPGGRPGPRRRAGCPSRPRTRRTGRSRPCGCQCRCRRTPCCSAPRPRCARLAAPAARCSWQGLMRGTTLRLPEPPLFLVSGKGPQQRRPDLPWLGGLVTCVTHAAHATMGSTCFRCWQPRRHPADARLRGARRWACGARRRAPGSRS